MCVFIDMANETADIPSFNGQRSLLVPKTIRKLRALNGKNRNEIILCRAWEKSSKSKKRAGVRLVLWCRWSRKRYFHLLHDFNQNNETEWLPVVYECDRFVVFAVVVVVVACERAHRKIAAKYIYAVLRRGKIVLNRQHKCDVMASHFQDLCVFSIFDFVVVRTSLYSCTMNSVLFVQCSIHTANSAKMLLTSN